MATDYGSGGYVAYSFAKGRRKKGRNGPDKRDARKSVCQPSAGAASAGVDSTDR